VGRPSLAASETDKLVGDAHPTRYSSRRARLRRHDMVRKTHPTFLGLIADS